MQTTNYLTVALSFALIHNCSSSFLLRTDLSAFVPPSSSPPARSDHPIDCYRFDNRRTLSSSSSSPSSRSSSSIPTTTTTTTSIIEKNTQRLFLGTNDNSVDVDSTDAAKKENPLTVTAANAINENGSTGDSGDNEGGGSSGSDGNSFLSFWDATNERDRELRKRDMIRSLFRRLANLSLQDYQWRSNYFKKTEADRRVEESLARMMGEDAAYVRPMDASDDKIGPLGLAERKLVEWLSLVIEEEGRRAKMIASSEGNLVRPMDVDPTGTDAGPLSKLESTVVTFLDNIRDSETERAKTMTLRPKDLREDKRGPLGDAEYKAVETIEKIKESEMLRMEQSKRRGGELVRPIDVPGPLGELERWYVELFSAELERARAVVRNDGAMMRPKDSSRQGPMGGAEQQVSDALDVIKSEERERLKSIKKVLQNNRPMDVDRDSTLGLAEAFIVGVFKGPQLFLRVVDRVIELLQSSSLEEADKDILKKDPRSLSSTRSDGKDKGDNDSEL